MSTHALLITLRGKTTRVELADGRSITVGRTAECDVCLDDSLVSRRHAVFHGGRTVEVEDLGSHNGTLMLAQAGETHGETNTSMRTRIASHQRIALAVDATIQIGDALITIETARPRVEQKPAGAIVLDPAMRRLYELAARVAASELAVLLLGESGVGKEVLARYVHERSPRAHRDLVSLNCGAMPEHILEAELFGYEKGAFTGAVKTTKGLLETASGGTLFLDEVGELAPAFQVKLLRVLEVNQLMRVGGREPIAIDVRYVAATNRDLSAEVAAGRFREDLFYRLNGFTLTIPPLRARKNEIVAIAESFLREDGGKRGALPFTLSPAAVARLEAHHWPGNVRQLRNVVRRAAVLCTGNRIDVEHLELPEPQAPAGDERPSTERVGRAPARPTQPLVPAVGEPDELRAQAEALEKQRILDALDACAGNQTRAAEMLGLTRRALVTRLNKFDIARPRRRTPED